MRDRERQRERESKRETDRKTERNVWHPWRPLRNVNISQQTLCRGYTFLFEKNTELKQNPEIHSNL